MSSYTSTVVRSPRSSRIPSPSSSPSTPRRSPTHYPRRPSNSISSTMHWLSRSPTQSPPYSPSKPVRISEPKRVRTVDIMSPQRNGTLGAGATIVRTPDEALRETGVRLSPDLLDESTTTSSPSPAQRESLQQEEASVNLTVRMSNSSVHTRDSSSTPTISVPTPPTSPPLPPLPSLPDGDEDTLVSDPESPVSPSKSHSPPRSKAPSTSSRRSSLKVRRVSAMVEGTPSVPPLPPHIVASNQPPPFHALLISEPSLTITDPFKIMITLETCTATHRTTLATIQSRPSHLSNYLSSLILGSPISPSSDTKSIASNYSTEPDDLAIFNRHLTSQGLVPHSTNIHLFLDRSSAPYGHILTYLRTPVIEGQPEVLPRSLQLHSAVHPEDRLESLIEVRDEAAFLNLEGLHKLCTDEIRLRYGPRLHSRGSMGHGAASIHSLHASVYSLHTLLERVETDLVNASVVVGNALESVNPGFPNSVSSPTTVTIPKKPSSLPISRSSTPSPPGGTTYDGSNSRSRSPPTPQSWDGPRVPGLEQRASSRQSQTQKHHSGPTVKPAPAGWI